MMPKKTKAKAQKIHAAGRFNERYSIKLTQHVWDQILGKIKGGKARLIEKQSLRVKLYDVFVELNKNDIINHLIEPSTIKVRVVYDKTRGTIVSALPLDSTDISED